MYLFALTLILIIVLISYGNCYYAKCCKPGEYITETKSSYKCVENKIRRLYVTLNETDFLEKNSDGECVDASTDFFTFMVSDGKIVNKTYNVDNYFPKCCPLNYSYNSELHSCEESDKSQDFITQDLVKVGLPNCKIIVDYEMNTIAAIDTLQAPNSYCIDRNEKDSYVLRECKQSYDVCRDVKCIKKCCPDGQSFINRSQCFDTFTHGLNLSAFSNVEKPEDPYAIIHGRSCPSLFIMRQENYVFQLDDKGYFKLWDKKGILITFDVNHTKSYCIEHTKTKTIDAYLVFRCAADPVIEEKFKYTLWPKVVSVFLLLLTIFIYVILRETKKMSGKILINYCVSLLVENVVLIYAQTSLHPSSTDCKIRSFLIIYLSTAVFTWSNVICYDIYRTFGSTHQSLGLHHNGIKKLLIYLIYGWGVPTIVTLVIFLFYTYEVLPYSIQPFMATKKCFFENKEGNYSHALFLNLPHLVIQLINMTLFIKTVIYCLKVKKEINNINDSTEDDKRKSFKKETEGLFLILKLSVIMGVSFILEVVSAFIDMKTLGVVPKYIEVIWDFINCLQGVFIFIIFICKKKTFRDLSRKCLQTCAKPRNLSISSLHTLSTSLPSDAMKISTKVGDNSGNT